MAESVDDLISNFEAPPDTAGLGRLSELCQQMEFQQRTVDDMEAALSIEKGKLHALRTQEIPGLMREFSLKELKLESGATVKVGTQVSCKAFEGKRADALEWLDANGFSEIVKREVGINFDRGQEERASLAVTLLAEAGFNPFMLKDVHHATLKAWASKLVKDGQIAKIPADLFDVNYFDIAEVKHGKK